MFSKSDTATDNTFIVGCYYDCVMGVNYYMYEVW